MVERLRDISDGLIDYGLVTLVLLALAFALAERVLPSRNVDRRLHLHLDMLAAVVGLCSIYVAYRLVHAVVGLPFVQTLVSGLTAAAMLPSVVKLLCVLILVDFSIYWLHRAMHHWSFLWRMHKWHHSVEQLYWFSGFRASFFHLAIYAVPQVLLPYSVFGLNPLEIMLGSALGHFVQLWTHSSLRVRQGVLARVIVTPDYHRIHHLADVKDKRNLSNIFVLWDRLFGTYSPPDGRQEEGALGLPERETGYARMMLGL